MEKTEKKRHRFGLLGRNISYSFSRGYFGKKFAAEGLEDHSYENFDLDKISEFPGLVQANSDLRGLNVTIPYKEEVIPYLNTLDPIALQVGAVNTIAFEAEGLKGYNTDTYGFKNAILPLLNKTHKAALVLGTGGASKAVTFVLKDLGFDYLMVSRKPVAQQLHYADIDKKVLQEHTIVINCTPLGTFPRVEDRPDIPYDFIGTEHLLFDLIYNPEKTAFLKAGALRGATTSNGLHMLEQQAEEAWKIWNAR